MKEQNIYHVTLVEKIDNVIEATNVIQGIDRKILFDGKVSAVTQRSAEAKAMIGIIVDSDNLEVKVEAVNFPG